MNENKFLNEEKYQKTEKKITIIALLILVIGLCIGGFLIYNGVAKPGTSKVEELKVALEAKKSELESKGVRYNEFARYTDGDEYSLKVITKALDPSFSNCSFDEYKNNSLTKDYCAAKNSTGFFASSVFILLGVFVCILTCIISGSTFMIAKRRKMLAFQVQQVMPVAKEGIEEMAPTAGKAAEEIARGIKKGFKD